MGGLVGCFGWLVGWLVGGLVGRNFKIFKLLQSRVKVNLIFKISRYVSDHYWWVAGRRNYGRNRNRDRDRDRDRGTPARASPRRSSSSHPGTRSSNSRSRTTHRRRCTYHSDTGRG